MYQTQEENIWADFENLLAYPDLSEISTILDAYEPDMYSDYEHDRDMIISVANQNGFIEKELNEFVLNGENYINNIKEKPLENLISKDGYYLTFNYTHTLENIYNIPNNRILHIHGEIGRTKLEFGYPEGKFNPGKICYDFRQKGRGPYTEIYWEDYINIIDNYYTQKAFQILFNKCKSFKKKIHIKELEKFLEDNNCNIDEFIVYGHSCKIDFDYFSYLNDKYKNAKWIFYYHEEDDKYNIYHLIKRINISNTLIKSNNLS